MVRKRLLIIFILTELLMGGCILWGSLVGAFGVRAVEALLVCAAINVVTSVLYFIGLRKYQAGTGSIFTYLWSFGLYMVLNDLMIGLLFYDVLFKSNS